MKLHGLDNTASSEIVKKYIPHTLRVHFEMTALEQEIPCGGLYSAKPVRNEPYTGKLDKHMDIDNH